MIVNSKDLSKSQFLCIRMKGSVETEAKAYIVPKMTVPILLGEDYQMNYEVNVNRSLREGNPMINHLRYL